MKMIVVLLSVLCTFATASTTVQGANSNNAYFANLYTYYSWNASFVLCALWGSLWYLLSLGDQGQTYTRCVNAFQSSISMKQV